MESKVTNVTRDSSENKQGDLGVDENFEYYYWQSSKNHWTKTTEDVYGDKIYLTIVHEILNDIEQGKIVTPHDYSNAIRARRAFEHLDAMGRVYKLNKERYSNKKQFESWKNNL